MFENVQFFSHLHLKYAKSTIRTQKIFFLKNINMDIKKCWVLCWFQFRWCRLKQMPLKQARAKNYANFEYFRFCAFFCGSLLLIFVWGISENRHQRIWNRHKILRFLIPILIIFTKKKFWDIIALLHTLNAKAKKNCTFSNILQKVKSYFFGNIYQSPFDSCWISKKSIKLKPPITHVPNDKMKCQHNMSHPNQAGIK